jgi:hypothetical protein
MTPPSRLPTPITTFPHGRRRRAKRGVVAGYIHDISPRHRGAETTALVPAAPGAGMTPAGVRAAAR